MRLNIRLITSFLGLLLTLNGGFMLLCLPFGIYYGEQVYHLLISSSITLFVGIPIWTIAGKTTNKELSRRDGYIVVTIGWLVMVISGTLPYLISDAIPDFTNAFFESMSGYTTTGSTILDDIEAVPKNILFWRSLTQWIGGMGIIVLAVAILPILGIGGMQLFVAESPGIAPDKLKPRIKDTATRLWLIYIGFTVTELILLLLGGMSFYDAINHSLTTISSGGFSVKQDSIGFYKSPFIHYVIVLFMLVAGSNFALSYYFLKAQFRKLINNEEFRYYIVFILGITALGFLTLRPLVSHGNEITFRQVFFQVVSIITTTGYSTADYTGWSPFLTHLFLVLMFVGASAGSTAGGVKLIRHIVLFKNSILSMNRVLHPKAIFPVRISNKSVNPNIISQIYSFIGMYMLIFLVGVLVLLWLEIDFTTSIGATATALGNIGPGIGNVGPSFSFAQLPLAAKWVLSLLMLLGRLELYTVLVLFTTFFWRRL